MEKEMSLNGNQDNSEGSATALFVEPMSQNMTLANENRITDCPECVESGHDNPEDVDSELGIRVDEAFKEGRRISERKKIILSEYWKHISVFRIRLGDDPPAHNPTMKIRLDLDKTQVKAKVQR